jgi:hypothetical protein
MFLAMMLPPLLIDVLFKSDINVTPRVAASGHSGRNFQI